MSRKLAITKRVDLSEISEGWEDCYAIVTSATSDEVNEIAATDLTSLSNKEALEASLAMAKDHFVRGKIRVLNDDGETELVDMEADDIAQSIDVIQKLALAAMGVIRDPKASSTVTATLPTSEATPAQ